MLGYKMLVAIANVEILARPWRLEKASFEKAQISLQYVEPLKMLRVHTMNIASQFGSENGDMVAAFQAKGDLHVCACDRMEEFSLNFASNVLEFIQSSRALQIEFGTSP